MLTCLPDCISPKQFRRFVRLFTHRVAGDALLSPAFPGPHHAPAAGEYAWWEQALAGRHYTGRPPHREATPPFTARQIGRWCSLLETSLDETLSDPGAAEAKGLVLNLATMLAHWQLNQQGVGTAAGQLPVAWMAA